MKYETPELSPLSPAIYAIQGLKPFAELLENAIINELISAYEDWE
jgi:hypothetical protein